MSVMQKLTRKSCAPAPAGVASATPQSGDGKAGSNGDTLARHFLDLLIEDAGGRPPKQREVGDYEDETLKLLAELAEDDDEDEETEEVHISVDLAAAAVRIARAIEPEIGLVKALRKEAPVVVIETGDSGVNDDVEKVLKVCVLGRSTKILGPLNFDQTASRRKDVRSVAVFERTAPLTGKDINDWSKRFGHALQARYPIVGIAADPATHLPKDLLRIADYRISLDPLGASGVALVIGAVTGQEPSAPMDADFARNVDLSDLRISIHADRGADGSMDKLVDVIKRRLVIRPAKMTP